MKSILAVAALLAALPVPAQTTGGPAFVLRWTGPEKTIEIEDHTIHMTVSIHEYDNPASSVPSSTRVLKKTARVTPEQMDSLRALLKQVGFWKLDPSYGAPATERHYPYTIEARVGRRSRTVTFRSHPMYGPAPDAFKQVERAIAALADAVTDWQEE